MTGKLRKMRIGIYTTSGIYPYATSGPAVVLFSVLKGLAERGHEVCLYANMPKGAHLDVCDELVPIGCEGFLDDILENVRLLVTASSRFVRHVSSLDILHFNSPPLVDGPPSSLAFPLVSRMANTKQTYYLQGALINEQVGSVRRYMFNVAAHLGIFDKIIVATNYALDKAAELVAPKSLLTIIPQSIVSSWYEDGNDRVEFAGDSNILYVGRLAKVKRIDLFLRAFGNVVQDFPKTHAYIIGNGPEEESLRCLSNRLKLNDRVHFLGFIPYNELPKYYSSSDIFVNCSDWPDPALTILEAMASHCAVIVSEMCCHDTITHGHNGVVFRNQDYRHLSTGLRALLEDESLGRKLAQNAYHTVKERFDYKVVATQFERLFGDLIHAG